MLQPIVASQARKDFFHYLNLANQGQPVSIKGRNINPVIMLSQEEYEGWLETLEIFSNKNLSNSLQAGLKDVKKKNIVSQKQAEEFLGWAK